MVSNFIVPFHQKTVRLYVLKEWNLALSARIVGKISRLLEGGNTVRRSAAETTKTLSVPHVGGGFTPSSASTTT